MKIVIQYTNRGLIWIDDDSVGLHYPIIDHLGLQDLENEKNINFFRVAEENEWDSYGIGPKTLAKVLSHFVEKLEGRLKEKSIELSISPPEALAKALGIEVNKYPAQKWLTLYPTKDE